MNGEERPDGVFPGRGTLDGDVPSTVASILEGGHGVGGCSDAVTTAKRGAGELGAEVAAASTGDEPNFGQ
jgi:hypothetical protein